MYSLYVYAFTQQSCLHDEEASPEVLILLSPKVERLGSFFVSCSLLDNRGFEEEDDDDRESKRHELHDDVSLSFSPVPVSRETILRFSWFIFPIRF